MKTARRLLFVTAAVAVSLVSAVPAHAATEVASGVDLRLGPRLFGPGLAYVENKGTAGDVVLRRATPGSGVQDIRTGAIRNTKCGDEDCDGEDFGFDSDGTPGRIAFSPEKTFDLSGKPRRFSLFTGGNDLVFTKLFECVKTSEIRNYDYAVDGDAIAYQADSCVDGMPGTRVVVRDFAAGGFGVKSYPLSDDSSFVLAGKYLATVAAPFDGAPQLKVLDWTNGTTLYSAALPDRVFSLDAQDDGKVVVGFPRDAGQNGPPLPGRTRPTRCDIDVAWLSAAEPTPHTLASCGTGAVQIEGDRLYFTRADSKTVQIAQSGLTGDATAVVSLKPAGVIPTLGSTIGTQRFDVDGTRLGYAVSRCLGESLYVQDVPAPAATDETLSCPTSITSNKLRVSKSGTVKLPLDCAKGCRGDLTLYKLRTDGSNSVEYRPASKPGTVIKPGTKRVTLKLSSKALKEIRKKGKLKVDAQLFGPPWGTERTVTLVK